MVGPGRSTGQPRVQPVRCLRGCLPVEAGVGDGHGLFGVPGGEVTGDELAAVFGRSAAFGVVDPWRCRTPHDTAGAQPAKDLDGQVVEQVGDTGCVFVDCARR